LCFLDIAYGIIYIAFSALPLIC